MDHLLKYLGNVDVPVDCEYIWQWRKCCLPEIHDFGHPFPHCHQYQEFFKFPGQHDWEVDPATYKLAKKPKDHLPPNASAFVQLWLFFGLLNIVVRTDKPFLHMEDLVQLKEDGAQGEPIAHITTEGWSSSSLSGTT